MTTFYTKDYGLTAKQLQEKRGGYWGNHPGYPARDWRFEVENGDERRGYWEWVVAQLEIEAEELDQDSPYKI